MVIAGPTAAGKTAIAVELASSVAGEIISADAMQVYRYMDIGTAKPTASERTRAPHHLIDILDPDEPFDAARYARLASGCVDRLHARRTPVFVVGGTGLYIKALLHGLFEGEPGSPQVRRLIRMEGQTRGVHSLYERLREGDPRAAARIHPNDTFRIVRALEVAQTSKTSISRLQEAHGFKALRYRALKFVLSPDRPLLYECIDRRVDEMLEKGFLGEVQELLSMGYGPALKSMRSIGYRHMSDYLGGRLSWEEAVHTMKRDTRRYAKRQLTWFRADSENLWLSASELLEMGDKIRAHLTV